VILSKTLHILAPARQKKFPEPFKGTEMAMDLF